MKKVSIVLGAAAVAVLAGCKDPSYRSYSSVSQDEAKPAEATPAPEEVKTAEPEAAPVEAEPVEKTPAPKAEVAPTAEEETTTYIVQRGDYLAKISKKYNVTIAAIRRLNPQIKADNVIRAGQKIKLPGKIDVGEQKMPAPTPAAKKAPATATQPYTGATKEYVVKAGDTLGGIAHAYGLKIRQLKELNGLQKDVIRVGQKLKVPTEKQVAAKKAEAKPAVAEKKAEPKKAEVKPAETAPVAAEKAPAETVSEPAAETAPAAAEPAEAAPANEVSYTVLEGEDLTDVAIKFSVSQAAIRDLNNLGDAPLKAGQVLKLPADAEEQQ